MDNRTLKTELVQWFKAQMKLILLPLTVAVGEHDAKRLFAKACRMCKRLGEDNLRKVWQVIGAVAIEFHLPMAQFIHLIELAERISRAPGATVKTIAAAVHRHGMDCFTIMQAKTLREDEHD